MKINWKDVFGKKRIRTLESENHMLKSENRVLCDMLVQQTNYVGEIKELKIQKFKVNYRNEVDWLATPSNSKFIRNELSKKLVEELFEVITFHGQFNKDTLTYEYTASLEVVL